MDLTFAQELMEKTGFPVDARQELLTQGQKLLQPSLAEDFGKLMEDYRKSDYDGWAVKAEVEELAGKAGMHPYTLWLLLLIECSGKAKPLYMAKGISEKVYWDTFTDLKYKLWECWDNYGVWGNFVAFWYGIFFRADIVKLGRLEYENRIYYMDTPYTFGDVSVGKGDSVISVHIPSSGEPFDRASVLESLRLAYTHFGRDKLVCICHSWLLYPGYESVYPEGGNVRDFRALFDVVCSADSEEFGDGWRVFASAWGSEPAQLPEKTAMQRAFKKHILAGGKHGDAFGVLIFDGKEIVNR